MAEECLAMIGEHQPLYLGLLTEIEEQAHFDYAASQVVEELYFVRGIQRTDRLHLDQYPPSDQ